MWTAKVTEAVADQVFFLEAQGLLLTQEDFDLIIDYGRRLARRKSHV
jgi:hypothetical protein